MRLVKIQAATRNHLRAFLDSRSSGAAPSGTPAGTPPSSGPSSAALAAALTGLARTFPDQQRALDNLQKLRWGSWCRCGHVWLVAHGNHFRHRVTHGKSHFMIRV